MKETQAMRALQSRATVYFDRANGVYSAGETLAGRLELNFLCDIRVRAIKLHFHGHARVSWAEQRAYIKGSAPSVSHKNSEVFLDQNVYLLRKGQFLPDVTCGIDGNACQSTQQSPTKKSPRKNLCFPLTGPEVEEGVLLPAGMHRFEFILPRHLPGSFEGKWGQIFYGVRVTLERPWKRDIEVDNSFIVESVVDFNDEPEVVRPIAGSGHFNIGLICCRSGALYVDVRVSRKGFVRGEAIPFYVQLVNDSYTKMRDSRVALIQHAVFRAGSKVRKSTRTVRSISRGEIRSGQRVTWDNETIEVPLDTIPSTSNRDEWKGITIKYTLTVTVTPSLWGQDLVVPVHLVIGTVSLRRETAQRYLSQFLLPSVEGINSLTRTPRRAADSGGDGSRRRDSTTSLKQSADVRVAVADVRVARPPNVRRGRQSVPCITSLPVSAGEGHVRGRRASAFELGALPKHKSGGDLMRGQKLSTSLDAVLQGRPKLKQSETDSRRKLNDVFEEDSDQHSEQCMANDGVVK